MRYRFFGTCTGLMFAASVGAQTAGQLAFEVATIKPAEPPTVESMMSGKLRLGIKTDAARVDIGSMSLAELIRTAYRVKPYQVSGPDWISAQRFDIQAKIPENASADQVPEMLQSLLAERFHLTLHREKKDHSVYALVVGKNGLKLQEAAPDGPAGASEGGSGGPSVSSRGGTTQFQVGALGSGKATVFSSGGGTAKMDGDGSLHFQRKMTAAALSDFLGRFVDRPVVDMTDLKGTYDVTLDVPMADLLKASNANVVVRGTANGAPMDPGALRQATDKLAEMGGGGSIFSAIEKLGLKLESRKAPIEILIVDHAERTPVEN